MEDIRKWMTLTENEWLKSGDLTNWYSDADVAQWFPKEGEAKDGNIFFDVHGNWFELLDEEDDEQKELALAQDYFAEWVMDELKPAWISNIKILDDEERYSQEYYWKIEQGEDDPDEY